MAWVTLSSLYAVFISAFLEALGLALLDHFDVDLRHVPAGFLDTLRCVTVEAHVFLSGAFFLPESLFLEDKRETAASHWHGCLLSILKPMVPPYKTSLSIEISIH
jgi:hypothetical protein